MFLSSTNLTKRQKGRNAAHLQRNARFTQRQQQQIIEVEAGKGFPGRFRLPKSSQITSVFGTPKSYSKTMQFLVSRLSMTSSRIYCTAVNPMSWIPKSRHWCYKPSTHGMLYHVTQCTTRAQQPFPNLIEPIQVILFVKGKRQPIASGQTLEMMGQRLFCPFCSHRNIWYI